MADYSGPLKRILSEAGCRKARQGKGDHEIWYSPLSGVPSQAVLSGPRSIIRW
jgi:hypothetical protein